MSRTKTPEDTQELAASRDMLERTMGEVARGCVRAMSRHLATSPEIEEERLSQAESLGIALSRMIIDPTDDDAAAVMFVALTEYRARWK